MLDTGGGASGIFLTSSCSQHGCQNIKNHIPPNCVPAGKLKKVPVKKEKSYNGEMVPVKEILPLYAFEKSGQW